MSSHQAVEMLEKMDELLPLIRETLASGKSIRLSPMGTSMLPMLRQGKDSVVLSPAPEVLSMYDLPLYRRDNGKCYLHRVVGVGERYQCMGDNLFIREADVRPDQIIGLVTAFYRGEKLHRVNAPGYRLYCRVWYHSRYLRRWIRRGIRWLKRFKPSA